MTQPVTSEGSEGHLTEIERAIAEVTKAKDDLKSNMLDVVRTYEAKLQGSLPPHAFTGHTPDWIRVSFSAVRDKAHILVATHFSSYQTGVDAALVSIGRLVEDACLLMERGPGRAVQGFPVRHLEQLGAKRRLAEGELDQFDQRFVQSFRTVMRESRDKLRTPSAQQAPAAPPRYEYRGKLGDGRYGEVYRARDHKLNRDVAIKIIKPEGAGAADALTHARALARVRHPNVVVVHEVQPVPHPETSTEVDGVVMEFVDGNHLGHVLGPGGVDSSRAMAIGLEIVEGLRAIHDAGLVHFDLHEENVLIDKHTARIIDIHYVSSMAMVSTRRGLARLRVDFRALYELLSRLLRAVGRSPRVVNDLADAEVYDFDRAKAAFEQAFDEPDSGAPAGASTGALGAMRPFEVVKLYLLDPKERIRLYSEISDLLKPTCDRLNSDEFTTGSKWDAGTLASRLKAYEESVHDLVQATVVMSRWAESRHYDEIHRILRTICGTTDARPGLEHWNSVRSVPFLLVSYAAAAAAIEGGNFDGLRAFLGAPVRVGPNRQQAELLRVMASQAWDLSGSLRRLPEREKNHTPVSEYLHQVLRDPVRAVIDVGADWDDLFDRVEITLAMIHAHDHEQSGPIGRFGYRPMRVGSSWEAVTQEIAKQGAAWPPLRAGFFDGQPTAAKAAQEEVLETIGKLHWR